MKPRQRPKSNDKSKYVQLSGKCSDNDSGDETELFTRKKPFQKVPTIEKPVEDGDTLQAISIRYHCTIAELKRLNNIHKENEIFARPTIKVPARPLSMALAGVHTSGTSSPNEANGIKAPVDINTLQKELSVKFLNLPNTNTQQTAEEEVKQLIFNTSLKPLERDKPDETNEGILNSTSEEILLLPKAKETVDPAYSWFSWSGVDGDIPLIALIVCIVVIIFAVPLIYVFYVAEHPEQYHHQKHTNRTHYR